MKKYSVVLFLFFVVLIFSNCGGGDDPKPEPTEQEKVLALLTGVTWKIQSVTVSGVNAMELFSNLTVSFSSTRYSTTNGGPVWPATGTWQFGSTDGTKINRNDGKEITITSIDANTFVCKLYWDVTIYGGRSKALEGEHIFTFSK